MTTIEVASEIGRSPHNCSDYTPGSYRAAAETLWGEAGAYAHDASRSSGRASRSGPNSSPSRFPARWHPESRPAVQETRPPEALAR
jgi:hypothetical protein